MTNELLDPSRFTHLVVRDIQLQSLMILTTKILNFVYNSDIQCHH
jgi:hypothetical protein